MKLDFLGRALTAASLVSFLFIAACNAGGHPVAGRQGGYSGNAQLRLSPRISAGRLRQVKAVLKNYTKANIDHVVLKVSALSDNGAESPVLDDKGTPVETDLPSEKLNEIITFSHLRRNTTYRVRAFAYKAPGTRHSDLISTIDARSYVDVPVGDDDQPQLTVLQVQLVDVLFDASAATGIQVNDGGFVYNGSVAIGSSNSSAVQQFAANFFPEGEASLPELGSYGEGLIGTAVDKVGNIFYCDSNRNCVYKIDSNGAQSIFAGAMEPGYSNGSIGEARFNHPSAITVDGFGNLYVADSGNRCIRKITASQQVSTLAGNPVAEVGYQDGEGMGASFIYPSSIYLEQASSNLMVGDGDTLVRIVSLSGQVTTRPLDIDSEL